MKVLLLGSKEYPFGSSSGYDRRPGGGIEAHVEKLAKYLSKDGNEAFIITRKFPAQNEEEHIGKIHVYRIGYMKNIFLRTLTFNRNAAKKAAEQRVIGPKRIIDEVDIIHCHGPVAGFFGSRLAKKFKKPMIFTPHGIVVDWCWPIKKIVSYFEKKSFASAKKNIFIAENEAKALGGTSRNSILLSNAVDLDEYPEAKRTWKGTRFLFLGRLEEVKGIKYLMNAFKKLSSATGGVELYIGGRGSMEGWVADFAERNGLAGRVKTTGWVKAADALSKTDVFVLPSWETGQPIALLEAMASGKVIITSLSYIRDGRTGIMVKAKDIDGLYEKMLYVHKNLHKCRQLGRNARSHAKERYSWPEMIKKVESVYKECISS